MKYGGIITGYFFQAGKNGQMPASVAMICNDFNADGSVFCQAKKHYITGYFDSVG
jgi:hypothetical protein